MQEHRIKVKKIIKKHTHTHKYQVGLCCKCCNQCEICTALFSGIAKACEQNLKKTFVYGGRIVPPNGMELKAMMVGASINLSAFRPKKFKSLLEIRWIENNIILYT